MLVEDGPQDMGPMTAVIAHGPCARAYVDASSSERTPLAVAGPCACFYFAYSSDVVDTDHMERRAPDYACTCGGVIGEPCYIDLRVTDRPFASHDDHG